MIKTIILGAGSKNWPDCGYILKLLPIVFTFGLDMGVGRKKTLVVLDMVEKMAGGTG